MTKLTETQTIILITGAQRPENIAMPLPKGLAQAYSLSMIAVKPILQANCYFQRVLFLTVVHG